MAWTLQPRSYMQAIRPNLYNIAYRRTGAYKGMGWLGQGESTTPVTGGTCPGSPGCPEFQTAPCPGTPGCPGYVDPYQNISTLTEGVLSGQNVIVSSSAWNQLTGASVSQPASTTPRWLPWVLVGVIAMMALGPVGGRR